MNSLLYALIQALRCHRWLRLLACAFIFSSLGNGLTQVVVFGLQFGYGNVIAVAGEHLGDGSADAVGGAGDEGGGFGCWGFIRHFVGYQKSKTVPVSFPRRREPTG